MDLVSALAAFYHLSFCFDLKYPKEGQTVADLLQRRVCKYGDGSGAMIINNFSGEPSKCSQVSVGNSSKMGGGDP